MAAASSTESKRRCPSVVANACKILASKAYVVFVCQRAACVVVSTVASLSDTSALRRSPLVNLQAARAYVGDFSLLSKQASLPRRPRVGALLDMFLLQLIHNLAHGPDFASPEDAEQLARFVAGCKEAVYLQETGRVDDSWVEHPSLDESRLRDYTRVTLEAFAHFSEDRDRFIECMERQNNAVRQMRKFQFDMWQIEMQRKRELQRKRDLAIERPMAGRVALRRAPQLDVAQRLIAEFL